MEISCKLLYTFMHFLSRLFMVELDETILTITWMCKEFKIAKIYMENKEYGGETCTTRFHDLKLHEI